MILKRINTLLYFDNINQNIRVLRIVLLLVSNFILIDGVLSSSPPAKLDSFSVISGPRLNYVAWGGSTSSNVTYRIYRGSTRGNLTFLDSVNQLYFLDTNLVAWREYYYSVAVMDSLGNEGIASDTLKGVPNNIWWVDSLGDDSNLGTKWSPFSSFTKAISVAQSQSKDTIFVKPGTYKTNINPLGKNLVIEGMEGAAKTLIEPNDTNDYSLYIANGEPRSMIVKGFTFQKSLYTVGNQIDNGRSYASIQNCIFKDCGAPNRGQAVVHTHYGGVRFDNCIFYQNKGKVFYFDYKDTFFDSGVFFLNSTFVDNHSYEGGDWVHGPGKIYFSNCILWDTKSDTLLGLTSAAKTFIFQNSLIKDNYFSTIGNNSNFNPEFIDAQNGDFRLKDYSKAIGIGEQFFLQYGHRKTEILNFDFNGSSRPSPSGSNPDLGAHENSQRIPSPILTEIEGGDKKAILTWNQPLSTLIKYFKILRSTGPISDTSTNGVIIDTLRAGARSYTDSNLSNLKKYYYRIKWIDSNGVESGLGNQLSVIPNILPPTPDSFRIDIGPRVLQLKWKATSGSVKYRIYKGRDSSNLVVLVDSTSKLSYTDKDVLSGIKYFYSIRSVDTVGVPSAYVNVQQGVPNNIWWISTTGSNSNVGSSQSPILNIDTVFNRLISNDTIILEEGRFFVSLDLRNKAFTLASRFLLDGDTSHISRTILDGNQQYRVLRIGANNGNSVYINGITVQHGNQSQGAGIYFQGTKFHISNSLIISNKANGDINGAGIYFDGSGSISNTDFRDNRARKGGALMINCPRDSVVLIDGCNFVRDTASESGGVILNMGSGLTILRNSLITGNSGNLFYIQNKETNLKIINSTIADNNTSELLKIWYGKFEIENSIFANNGNSEIFDTAYQASWRKANPTYKISYKIRNSIFDIGNYKDSGVIIGEPAFAKSSRDPGVADDYRLSNTSPVLGRGLMKYSSGFDLLGQERSQPLGSAPDYGAIENTLQNYLDSLFVTGGYKRSVISWSLLPTLRTDLKVVVFKDSIFGSLNFKSVDTLDINDVFVDSMLSKNSINSYYINLIDTTGKVIEISDTQTVTTAANLYVSNIGNNKNAGTFKSPFKTIEYALSLCQKYDTIFVSEGLYKENLNIYTDSIVIFSLSGFKTTKLQSADNNKQLFQYRSLVRGLEVHGITFQNSKACIQTGGVPGNSGSFLNCRFTNNGTLGTSTFQHSRSSFKYINCLFDRNLGGFNFANNDTADGGSYFNYCTFIDNASFANSFHSGFNNAKVGVLNSIIWDNVNDSIVGLNTNNSYLFIKNSLVKDTTWSLLNSNFKGVPIFKDTIYYSISNLSLGNNYGLDSIDLGYGRKITSPQFDITNTKRPSPNNTRPDIGSYENVFGFEVIDSFEVLPGYRRIGINLKFKDTTLLSNYKTKLKVYSFDSLVKKSVEIETIANQQIPNPWIIKGIPPSVNLGFYVEVIDGSGYSVEYSDTLYSVVDTIVFLSPQGSDVALGKKSDPLINIQSTIQESGNNDTLFLLPGHYEQKFETKNNISIVGVEGFQKTSISTTSLTDACVGMRGSRPYLEGITIKNSKFGVTCHNFTYARINSCRITRCGKTNEWSFSLRGHDGSGLFTNVLIDSNYNNALSFDYKHDYGYRLYNCNIYNNLKFGGTGTRGPGKLWIVNSIIWEDSKDSIEVGWNSGYFLQNSSVKSQYQSSLGSNMYIPPSFGIYPNLSDTSRLIGMGTDSINFDSTRISVHVTHDLFKNIRPNPNNTLTDIGVTESPLGCPRPTIRFEVNDSLQCFQNHRFKFTNKSKHYSKSITFSWDFGDSSTSKAYSPNKVYSNFGNKIIKLIGIDDRGCSDTFLKEIRIAIEPISNFITNDITQCKNKNSFIFKDQSTVKSSLEELNSTWIFGDGETAQGDSVRHVYLSKTGKVSVKHIATTTSGCRDSSVQDIVLINSPRSYFEVDTNAQCYNNHNFKFTNKSLSGDTDILYYYWSLGDGKKDTLRTPKSTAHSYDDTGKYMVTLLVEDQNGCEDSDTQIIDVLPSPNSSFEIKNIQQCANNNKFSVVQKSSTGNKSTKLNYNWTFDNSTNTDSIPTFSFNKCGSYLVSLEIQNQYNCFDTSYDSVIVNCMPDILFSVNDTVQCENNQLFKFTDLSTIQTKNDTLSTFWDLGDGTTNKTKEVTHEYNKYDTLEVKLIVTTSFGCVDSLVRKVEIIKAPNGQLTSSLKQTNNCENEPIEFRARDLDASFPYSVLWKFENSQIYMDSFISVVFNDSGQQYVTLIIGNEGGCFDTINKEFYLTPKPHVSFGINTSIQCRNNNLFKFTDSSSSNLKGQPNLKYYWDFGDSTNSTTLNPTKSFKWFGDKLVKLIVSNDKSCSDTIIRKIEIKPEPIPGLQIMDPEQCQNNNLFTFKDTTKFPLDSLNYWVRWLVDGSQIGDSTDIQYYSNDSAKSYKLKMIAESDLGCKDSIEKPFRILPKPIVKIIYSAPDSCLSTSIIFKAINSAGNGIKNVNWLFSDSTRATGQSVSKKFRISGFKWIECILENTNGCFDTSRLEFNIHSNPVAKFIVDNYAQCFKANSFTFRDSSKAISGNLDSIRWNYADGTIKRAFSGSNNSYSFQLAGNYRIRLTAYNSFGCQDSTEKIVIVKANPTAGFFINNNSQCLNVNAFNLTNNSQPNNGNSNMSFTWEFGDSTYSSNRNVTKTYIYDGTKSIRLITSNSDGCVDTIEKSVTVRSMPAADFSINTVNQCVNQNAYNFSDISTIKAGSGILSRIWNLGDGSVSNQANISNKTYTTAQNFNVQLISRNNFNCADTVIKTISVLPKPNVNFTVNQDTQCLVSNNYSFNNQTSIVTGGGALSYNWNYGDGNVSNNTHPSHSYKNYGNYKVKLIVTSQFGCVDSLSRLIKIVANPLVDFGFVNSDKQCNSLDTFRLQNKTDKRNAFSISYVWNFGDGTTSRNTQVSKSYGAAGDYRVTLYAENNNGCKDSVHYSAKVYPDPETDFSINQVGQCINNQKFDFTNNTSVAYGGGSLSYQWLYSDTLFDTNTNSTRTFDEVKTYSIKLIASSSLGCKDSTSKNIVLYPKPSANFDINDTAQCLTNNVFKLTNNSRVSSGTNSYQWDFGDNTGNSRVSPDKVFTKFGTYTIELLALTNNGCRDSISRKVIVHSQPRVIFSRSDTALCRYQNSFKFTNNSSNADTSKLTYRWNYSDGNSDTVTSPTVSFKESGLYLVKLVGRTALGCLDSQIQSVRVFPQPLPSFTIKSPFQCLVNNRYEANNHSSISSEGGTLSYRWEFGDGNSSNSVNPQWKYLKDDTFKVQLYVESSMGCVDSLFKSVIVYPQPNVGFTVDDTSQCLGTNQFTFTNNSTVTYGSLKYNWNFGDGGRSVGVNPMVKYNSGGIYKVTMYAVTNFGCEDSTSENVIVHPDPQALFDVNDDNQCLRGNKFELKNNTLLSEGTYLSSWDFGDLNASNAENPAHTYSDDGIYVIRLKVTTSQSCIDSNYKIIQVYPQALANFIINDSVQCLNDNDFIFENKSIVNYGGLKSFWDYGDVSYSYNNTGRHSYSKAGAFSVQLVSSTAFGCSDTISQKVRITEIPQIAFTLDTTVLCQRGNEFRATNNSTYNGTEKIDYNWNSTDGYNFAVLNFKHSFAEPGKYELKLVGRTSEGCMDSSVQTLTVYPQGESKIDVFDSIQCLFGNDFTFINESKVDGASFSLMSWDFGGVYTDTQFIVSPNHFQFGDTGNFKVTLITTTENLCLDTSSVSVRVAKMPVAVLEHGPLSNCHNDQKFEYIDASPKELGSSNKWLFDKKVINNNDTLHPTFNLPGKYIIRLVVYSEYDCSDTISSIAISNEVPKARIRVNNNEQCLEKNEFIFSNLSSQFNQHSAFWDFGDGTFGSGNNIVQDYWDAGEYNVALVVENDSLCADTALLIVRVNPTPEAFLNVEPSCMNIPIDLESNSKIVSGEVVSYLWNMGDGTNFNDSLPKHKYRQPGIHYISLAMRSDKGCFAKFIDSIEIYPNPEAGISFLTDRPTILKNNVGFLDSSVNAASLEWNFGDGSDFVYDEYEVYHTYQDTGDYQVRLVVSSSEGCFDTSSRILRVWPDFNILLPTAFSPNEDGINDVYHIRGNHHSIKTANWQIYTEDGIKVFESDKIEAGWNGKLMNNGVPLPMGNYQINLVVKDMYGNQSQFNEKIAIIR